VRAVTLTSRPTGEPGTRGVGQLLQRTERRTECPISWPATFPRDTFAYSAGDSLPSFPYPFLTVSPGAIQVIGCRAHERRRPPRRNEFASGTRGSNLAECCRYPGRTSSHQITYCRPTPDGGIASESVRSFRLSVRPPGKPCGQKDPTGLGERLQLHDVTHRRALCRSGFVAH
jgi:hypothetical protein